MKTTDTEKVQINIDGKDFKSIQEMLGECNAAMVNFALTDNMKLIRSVTFFNTKDHDMESISASCNYCNRAQGNISLSKNIAYRIFSFNHVKRMGINFWAMLWKTIPGFRFDKSYHDCRTNKNK